MKDKLDKKYLECVLYVVLGATLIFISYNVVFNFKVLFTNTIGIINAIASIISPLIVGCIIAYLLYPLSKIINTFLVKSLKIKYKPHLISILLTYLVVILLVVILIYSMYAMIGGQISSNQKIGRAHV